jgi:hypothetical protein
MVEILVDLRNDDMYEAQVVGLCSRAITTVNGTAKFCRGADGAKAPMEPSVEQSTQRDLGCLSPLSDTGSRGCRMHLERGLSDRAKERTRSCDSGGRPAVAHAQHVRLIEPPSKVNAPAHGNGDEYSSIRLLGEHMYRRTKQ